MGPVIGDDGVARCPWAGAGARVIRGLPRRGVGRKRVEGEAAYLERLTLEAFQSGLSWSTILNKREAFREVFRGLRRRGVAGFRRGRRRAADGRAADRAQPAARSRRRSPTPGPPSRCASSGGLRGVHRLLRAGATAGADHDGGDGHHLAGVGGAVEGAEEAGVRVRRPDHDVRADGGDRHLRPPFGRLPPTW